MYGTIARMQVKPGAESQLAELEKGYESLDIPGFVASYVYRMDNNPNVYYLVAVFQDRDTYRRNAESPEQDARYREMRALLQSDPEWHDGEIVAEVAR